MVDSIQGAAITGGVGSRGCLTADATFDKMMEHEQKFLDILKNKDKEELLKKFNNPEDGEPYDAEWSDFLNDPPDILSGQSAWNLMANELRDKFKDILSEEFQEFFAPFEAIELERQKKEAADKAA